MTTLEQVAVPGATPTAAAGTAAGRHRGSASEPPLISVRRLLMRFVITGLAGLIVLATVTALVSRMVGTAEARREASRIATIAGHGIIEPALTPALVGGLLRGDPTSLDIFDRRVRADLLQGSLVRAKLWTPDGRIIYSDERRLVGRRFALDDDALSALSGASSEAHVSDPSSPENRFEPSGSRLLEVYSRVEGPAGEPFLFEPYFSYSAVDESGRRLWLAFAPVVLGSLLLLQLMQLPLAWSMARRLRRGQREREHLLRHAIEASESERRRIASDLHDGTVQDLAGVSLALSAAGRRADAAAAADASGAGADPHLFHDAARRVRGAITSLRSLLVEIYPPNLEREGLEQALSDMLERLPLQGVETHMDVSLPGDPLEPATTALIYRCAQETVRNVVRHARASELWLRVSSADGQVVLEVSDDGRGFDPNAADDAQAEGHIGLRALADLVADAGGAVELASAPGRGTQIRVEIPR